MRLPRANGNIGRADNEVKDLIPQDAHSGEHDLDELLTTIGMRGSDVLEGQPTLSSSAIDKEFKDEVGASEDVELDLTPGALEKSNDPVRIYLREMGMTPLLTREGEVDIAKRIERGQLRTLKALSRSPIVIRQILVIGEDLERGIRSIKEIIVFDEEEIIDAEILQDRLKDTTRRIDELQKHYKRASQLAERLPTILVKKKAREYNRCRYRLGREMVRISLIIRHLGFTNIERKRMIDRVNKALDVVCSLDRRVSTLGKKIESTRSQELRKDYRKAQRQHRVDLKTSPQPPDGIFADHNQSHPHPSSPVDFDSRFRMTLVVIRRPVRRAVSKKSTFTKSIREIEQLRRWAASILATPTLTSRTSCCPQREHMDSMTSLSPTTASRRTNCSRRPCMGPCLISASS